jgi:uncharacterized membrane protein
MTFAILHFTAAFVVAWILTGDAVIGGAAALIKPAVITVGFYYHELIRRRIESRDRLIPSAG